MQSAIESGRHRVNVSLLFVLITLAGCDHEVTVRTPDIKDAAKEIKELKELDPLDRRGSREAIEKRDREIKDLQDRLREKNGQDIGPEVVPVTANVSAFGCWPRTRGDNEMDTDGGDRVPVRVTTKLTKSTNMVEVEISFYCEEHGGNHTTFEGTRTFPVYTAPPGRSIVDIVAAGGVECSFTGETNGTNYSFNPFDTSGTYWTTLSFRVDGRGGDDHRRVGVGGTIRLEVRVE